MMWNPDSRYWIQDSTSLDFAFHDVNSASQVLDSKFHLSGFRISWCGLRIDLRYWIPDSTSVNSKFQKSWFWSYGFLDLNSGFHRGGFRIPQTNISWFLDSTSKCFLDYGNWITYMERNHWVFSIAYHKIVLWSGVGWFVCFTEDILVVVVNVGKLLS